MKKIMSFVLDGLTPQGRPKLRWKSVVNSDPHKKCLSLSLVSDRLKWRNAFRTVMH